MKTLTVRLPESLVAQIEAESRERRLSKSDVVRERLNRAGPEHRDPPTYEAIKHLIGSVKGLPPDLSANKKKYLKTMGYGRKRPR
jgi:hypothetical protein